jgi:DNA-binding NtrC family response regulator
MDATVLLVDDEEPVRHLVRMMLEMDGCTVLEAHNGEEAQEVADRHGNGIDLLVTDIMMPGIGGLELAQRLVARRPGLRVLFISGQITEEDISPNALRTRTAFLRKPFKVGQLTQAAHRLLEPRRGVAG